MIDKAEENYSVLYRAVHRRADALQCELDESKKEVRRHRQRSKQLSAEVAAFRGRIAGAAHLPIEST